MPELPRGTSWEDARKKLERGFMEVLRLRPGESTEAIILDMPLLFTLHWIDGQGSVLHYEPEADCPYCPRPVKQRWYAPAIAIVERERPAGKMKVWDRVILEMHNGNVVYLGDRLVVGLKLKLSRLAKDGSPLKVQIAEANSKDPSVIPAWDIVPALYRTWGANVTPKAQEEDTEADIIKFRKAN